MKRVQKARLKEFQTYLKEKKIDAALFYNLHLQEFDPNFYYFSDYDGIGFLVVPQKKKPFLIVPEMEMLRARKQASINVVVAKKKIVAVLREKLGKTKKIGIDKSGITVEFYERLKKELAPLKASYAGIGKKCAELRLIKTDEELRRIRKACKITDEIFSKTLFRFKSFKTEADVSAFMTNEAARRGLQLSFKPIVASGSDAAEPHHGSRDQKLKKGFCIIDYGIRYKGYCSDMTRTIYLGKPTAKELEFYDLVLCAQKKAIAAVKEGVCCKTPDESVLDVFGKHKRYFVHSTGHGVGLDIHEAPSISRGEGKKFKKGMVFTIEPGLYIPGKMGIRIEDDLLVTGKGTVVLTKTGKNLLVIR